MLSDSVTVAINKLIAAKIGCSLICSEQCSMCGPISYMNSNKFNNECNVHVDHCVYIPVQYQEY